MSPPASSLPIPVFTPVPRKTRNGWTAKRQAEFIALLAATGSVALAARRCGMTREGAYLLRAAPGSASFAAAWDAAIDRGISALKAAAIDRAINGTEEAVWHKGEQVGTRTRYNNQLTVRLLTHYDRPEKMRGIPPELDLFFTPEVEARLAARQAKVRTPEIYALGNQWSRAYNLQRHMTAISIIARVRGWLADDGLTSLHASLNFIERRAFADPTFQAAVDRGLSQNAPGPELALLKPLEDRVFATRVELLVRSGIV